MDERTKEVLEYPKIKMILSDFAATGPGTELCLNCEPLTDSIDLSRLLKTVSEFQELTSVEGNVPMGGVSDIGHLLDQLSVEGAYLSSHEILDVLSNLAAYRRISSFLKKLSENYPLAWSTAEPIVTTPDLEKRIEESIGNRGEILDTASNRLRETRKGIRQKRDKLQRILNALIGSASSTGVLQDDIITTRNGRFVIPVKAESKGKIPGIIHDRSQSGATFFVEPLDIMEDNNELSFLIKEEADEEIKVLKRLSGEIADFVYDIRENQRHAAIVDGMLARAEMGRALGGIAPEISDDGSVLFQSARHPLLAHSGREGIRHRFNSDTVVPIDISISGAIRTVILSGANTGGKTAALKTLGLLSLMFMTGIPIPVAEGSKAVVFQSIYADIGDEQDIEGKLSTFSAKLLRLNDILNRAGKGSLVLLDEIMSGTDPEQGGALALASLEYLSKKDATTLVTTHLNSVKAYALNREDAVNVSVVFDEITHSPLYRLHYGSPAGSNAILVAQGLGMPTDVINTALGLLTEEGKRLGDLIADIEQERLQVLKERETLSAIKHQLETLEKKSRELFEVLDRSRTDILDSFSEKLSQTVHGYEERFRELFSKMDSAAVKKGEVHNEFYHTKRELLESVPRTETPRSDDLNITQGDDVTLRGLSTVGKVLSITDDRAEVDMDGRKVIVDVHQLVRSLKTPRRRGAAHYDVTSDPVTEVNIIGMRVEEAIPVVDKAIDNALLSGMNQIDIIHGIGTGRLKKAIREHVKEHMHVSDVRHVEANAGVTTVELR
ncbi:MAG: Smr/MutS family protein [Deltaproteobacteria bacterium]|nr:Smr/MutS family protein [Candidatus Zymogenaceae bacterium]